eukprot:COSAG01_NODE_74760_length_201_cov_1.921569_1_plen_27_part_10
MEFWKDRRILLNRSLWQQIIAEITAGG